MCFACQASAALRASSGWRTPRLHNAARGPTLRASTADETGADDAGPLAVHGVSRHRRIARCESLLRSGYVTDGAGAISSGKGQEDDDHSTDDLLLAGVQVARMARC